jgi:hypothetical protein
VGPSRIASDRAAARIAWIIDETLRLTLEATAMRLPRVRFTVRRMMVGVAITGPLAWVFATAYRGAEYERLADFHDAQIIPIGSVGGGWH